MPPPYLPLLQSYSLGIGILHHLVGFGLQYGRDSLVVVFLGVRCIVVRSALGELPA